MACFCRARLAVGPRGILTTGGAAAVVSSGSAEFAFAEPVEVSGAGVDDGG